MEKRLSRFGIGPRMILSSIVSLALATAVTYLWPDVCVLRWVPWNLALILGGLLLLLGIPMWIIAVISVMRAYNRDRLVTSGVFNCCRHPVYGAWIVFNLPAIAVLTRSWPFIFPPLVTYAVFKWLVREEDEYLEKRFGAAYFDYRAKVNEVVPIPKF